MKNNSITDYNNYADYADIQYYMKNNSIPDYANYADFRDCVENSFITNYADYADIHYYMKNNPITDYANYTDYQDHLKNCFIMTTLTLLILNSTWKIISSWTSLTTLLWKATIDNAFINDYVDIQE